MARTSSIFLLAALSIEALGRMAPRYGSAGDVAPAIPHPYWWEDATEPLRDNGYGLHSTLPLSTSPPWAKSPCESGINIPAPTSLPSSPSAEYPWAPRIQSAGLAIYPTTSLAEPTSTCSQASLLPGSVSGASTDVPSIEASPIPPNRTAIISGTSMVRAPVPTVSGYAPDTWQASGVTVAENSAQASRAATTSHSSPIMQSTSTPNVPNSAGSSGVTTRGKDKVWWLTFLVPLLFA